MKLIDEDALIAEIEKLDALYHTSENLSGDLFIQGLFCFIDTTEMKKLDLDKEIKDYFDSQPIITRYKGVDYKLIPSGENIAKHFFELGMAVSNKAQKGE